MDAPCVKCALFRSKVWVCHLCRAGKVAMNTNFIKLTFILNISYDPLLQHYLIAVMKSFTAVFI